MQTLRLRACAGMSGREFTDEAAGVRLCAACLCRFRVRLEPHHELIVGGRRTGGWRFGWPLLIPPQSQPSGGGPRRGGQRRRKRGPSSPEFAPASNRTSRIGTGADHLHANICDRDFSLPRSPAPAPTLPQQQTGRQLRRPLEFRVPCNRAISAASCARPAHRCPRYAGRRMEASSAK
jgi:hypothetical protein